MMNPNSLEIILLQEELSTIYPREADPANVEEWVEYSSDWQQRDLFFEQAGRSPEETEKLISDIQNTLFFDRLAAPTNLSPNTDSSHIDILDGMRSVTIKRLIGSRSSALTAGLSKDELRRQEHFLNHGIVPDPARAKPAEIRQATPLMRNTVGVIKFLFFLYLEARSTP